MGDSDMVVAEPVLNREAEALYTEIATGRAVHPPRSPELNQLLLLGLITHNPADPGGYQAIDAAEVARTVQERLLRASARQLASAASVVEQWRHMADAYAIAHPAPAGGDAVEIITSRDEVQARLAPILASCTSELLTAQPGGPRPPAMLALSYQRDLAVLDRGARMRTIYKAAARRDPHTARWAQTVGEQGAEVRTVPDSAEYPRTVIVDGRVAVVGTDDPDRAVILRDPDLVRYVRMAWLRDWAGALPWDGTTEIVVTEMQAEILGRLAEGEAMESIGRAVGVSRRMVTHHLERLRETIGAKSTTALVYWWARHEGHFTPGGSRRSAGGRR